MKEYAKDFYKSAAWKRARQTVIKRANGLCERCRAAGLYRPGVIVHHKDYITPENIHNPGVTLNLGNLEYLCEDCHNKEHKASVITGLNGYSVYNKKHYQLTHLLEKGHQLRKGGRKVGNVKAFEHIAPVNETLGDLAVSKIRQKVRG